MPDRPSLHTELYDDVRPDALKGANKDKVAVVTGAARGWHGVQHLSYCVA